MTDAVTVNDQKLQQLFARLIEVGTNPSTYLGAIGQAVAEQTRLRFVDGRGPDGASWKPVLRGGAPLRDTGTHLMNRITSVVQGNSVTIGVPFAWARVHQLGATIHAKSSPWLAFKIGQRWSKKKSVTIPARPMFGINASDRAELADILRATISQGAGA